MTVNIKLKRTLKEKKVSSLELAARVEVSPVTISHLLTGKTQFINIRLMDKICSVIGCGVEDIMCYQDAKAPRDSGNELEIDLPV